MQIKSIKLQRFKRFAELEINELPSTARLVVLTGANGSGKSSVLEALNYWRRSNAGFGLPREDGYFCKVDADGQQPGAPLVAVEFHDGGPTTVEGKKKAVWIRSAYRHETDFASRALQRQGPTVDDPGLGCLLDVEQTVRKNYERLSSRSLVSLYDPANEERRVGDLRDEHIGRVRDAMLKVFDDLVLRSPGDPLVDGAFFFDKGESQRFHYKNLSAGEKAAFDLLLDFLLRVEEFDNTVFAIDEPELHIGSGVQARLLDTLLEHMPQGCQIWIATHSIGMMRAALSLHRKSPTEVVFLDTFGHDFDRACVLQPIRPDRSFWKRCLAVALGDVAALVSPDVVVLCEGADPRHGFDASCYRAIFSSECPGVEFISVGNSHEVKADHACIGTAIGVLSPGTKIIRLVDGDDSSEDERRALARRGVRVLSRRSIECYLLDDEVLNSLCANASAESRFDELRAARDREVQDRGQAPDDFKRAAGAVQVYAKKHLGLTKSGSNAYEFMRTTMAPLILPGTDVYALLRRDVLGEPGDEDGV